MTELEPSVRFARSVIVLAIVIWCAALGLSLVLLGGELLFPAEDHYHLELPLAFVVISALAIWLLFRARGDRVIAAVVVGTLTILAGGATLMIGAGFVILPVGVCLLGSLPQLDRHKVWRERHRAPELPRARVRSR